MSRKGNPIDDSPMESFYGILKKETLYNNDITTLEQYIDIVKDWLLFYNTVRLKLNKKFVFYYNILLNNKPSFSL